ncbi:Ankyrin-2 [Arthrobotrys entomopaga]|nr:Ankyrin-2 [Arthrobotrys entomopaga]
MASAPAPKKTYDIVQQGIKELYSPANAEVDIIAVPGLGTPPLDSWKSADPRNEFNWLSDKDGLPKEFPKARILLYMYQSAWYGPLKVRQFMSNLATTLLYALKDKRKDTPRRPLIFIGHSMGGAVSSAESRKDIFGKMFEAITGCIFFGTPFDGAHAAAAATMFSQASEFFRLDQATHSKLLDLLKIGDEGLRDIKNDFMRLCTKISPKIELFCFYEEKPTDWTKEILPFRIPLPKKYEDFVTRESATLTGVDNIGLARTHRELVKFDSFKDTVYQIVRTPLKTIINSSSLIAKNRFNSTRGIDREIVKNVLSALEGVQIEKKRKRLAQGVISSSWILQEEDYKQWFGRKERSIDGLWVLGPEGKGKLGASLAVVDHIEEVIRQEEAQNSGQAANLIAYFLCDPTADGSSPEELLKSLLRQLVNQQEVLAAYAKQFVNTHKDSNSRGKTQAGLTVENLWQSLQDMLTDDLIGTVYFVINNLHSMDEDADSTKKLLSFINAELNVDYKVPHARVRWLLTSQNRHSIKRALTAPNIHMIDLDDDKYGNQVQQELRLHAQRKIAALGMEKGYNKALTYFAGSLIGKRAQNTQWIDITIIQLAELPIDARDLKVRALLERIPQDLRSLLDRAWQSVLDPKDEQLEEIKEMLRTLIITYEEPTEDDLAVLTGLSQDEESRAHLCQLVEKCRPLLTFHKSAKEKDKITFMNSVVKAHLLQNADRLLGLSVEEMRWQHGILALRNFTHLIEKFSVMEKDSDNADGEKNASSEEEGEDNSAKTGNNNTSAEEPSPEGAPVMDPPQEEEQPKEDQDQEEEEEEEKEEEEVEFEYSEDDEDYEEDEMQHTEENIEMAELGVSSYAVKHWLHHASKATADIAETLSQEEEFWKPDSAVREKWLKVYNDLTNAFDGVTIKKLPALHVAAAIGFAQLVTALIKNGYQNEIDTRDGFQNTPLHLAAYLGRPNITEVLLNNGAKVDDGLEQGEQTPLAMAAFKGHCKVMIKLLNRGANPNALADGGPVINEAIVSGNLEAVRLLVEHGALLSHDDEDDDNPPPLALSALLSDLTMFTYLLDACAEKIPHKEYNKAFISSASAGRIEVTKRLLKFQHDQTTFQEALEAAALEENWEILLLILESCQGLDCDSVFHQIAGGSEQQDRLLSAIWKHTTGTVSQQIRDDSLYEAVDREKESTVKLLLEEFGANANATGVEYGNALTAAAYDGTLEIVAMLLNHGAAVDSPNGWALQTAAEQGHLDVVKLLIEHGANVNASIDTDKFSLGTALQAATEAGQDEIVELLLKTGADPNIGAGPETCPIIAACRKGESHILELLLNAGAIVNRFGGPDLSSPLINAASTLYTDSVERLLNAGADINLADNDGDTALIVAADVADAELVAFLLEKGADITHVSNRNVNALQTALKSEATECVKLLVEAVTRVLTALGSAVKEENSEVKKVLQNVDFTNLAPAAEEEEEEGGEEEGDQEEEEVEDANVKGALSSEISHGETAEAHATEEINETSDQIKETPDSVAEISQTMVMEAESETVAEAPGASRGKSSSPESLNEEPVHGTEPQLLMWQRPLQHGLIQPEITAGDLVQPQEIVPQEGTQHDPIRQMGQGTPPLGCKLSAESPEQGVSSIPTSSNADENIPSPIRQNPAFPGYQDYQDFRKKSAIDLSPAVSPPSQNNSAIPSEAAESPNPQLPHTLAYAPYVGASYVDNSVPTSMPPSTLPPLNTSAPSPPVTLADQLQAYQSYQSIQASQPHQNYPGYQSYQIPSRKPLGSGGTPTSAESPKLPFQNSTNFQNYQPYQSYQSSATQIPSLSQAYQLPANQNGHGQDYQATQLPQSYQSPSVSQNFPLSQNFQPAQNFQSIPDQEKKKNSIATRISGYFQNNDPKNANGRFKYDSGWS